MDTKKIITNNQQPLSNQQKNNIALFLAILFHVCGLIGIIYTPYKEWLYKKLATDMQPSLVVQLFSLVIDAALLTTLFDYILEPLAVKLGYWKWLPDNSIPIYNFVCWSIINSALLTVFRLLKFNKHN